MGAEARAAGSRTRGASGTGSAGGRTWPSGSGAPCARTTRADGDVLGLLPARPRAQPRLPLGRGRPARHHRPRGPAVLRARAVERPRSDPQGAAVRPHRPGGQPRRGREGAVLLPRRHADPLLPEGALQVSAGGVPVRAAGPRRTASAASWSPSSSWPTPASSTSDRYFDVFAEYAKADAGRHPDPDHRRQPRARGRPRCTCCRRSGSATPGAGAATGEGYWPKPSIRRAGPAAIVAEHMGARAATCSTRSRATDGTPPELLFTENETNVARLFGAPNPQPYVKDAFHRRGGRRRRDAR